MADGTDKEVEAISACVAALHGLDKEACKRVVSYVATRYEITVGSIGVPTKAAPGGGAGPRPVATDGGTPPVTARDAVDVRSFKEEKAPKSAIEMAAVIAFYLSELAPTEDRKQTITQTDFDKYCKQAKYPVPKTPQTLKNAKAAGYFDSAERGVYELNSVGYNLVAHTLPRAGDS